MTRPPRSIDADADVLPDPALHWPVRPTWTCGADGQPWPCEPLRGHMLATLSASSIGVAMGAHYVFAIRELDAAPGDVHRQLLGWIRTA